MSAEPDLDAKQLGRDTLFGLAEQVRQRAAFIHIVKLEPAEVDLVDPNGARLRGLHQAANAARQVYPDLPLQVDGGEEIPAMAFQRAVPAGDALYVNTSAAGILAKAEFDADLEALDELYPAYGFAKHHGYERPEHLEAIRTLRLCPAHRPRVTRAALARPPANEELELEPTVFAHLILPTSRMVESHPHLVDGFHASLIQSVARRRGGPTPRQQFFLMRAYKEISKRARQRGIALDSGCVWIQPPVGDGRTEA